MTGPVASPKFLPLVFRVYRGGAFSHRISVLKRDAGRHASAPSDFYYDIGLRLMRRAR